MKRALIRCDLISHLTRIYNNLKCSMILLAFFEGLLSTHHLTFFFLYTKFFSLNLLTYTIFESILSVLFCLNPLYGYISDKFAFCGYKKKSYLIIMGIISTTGYLFVSQADNSSISVGVIFIVHFLIDMANSFRTVIIDSLCVILHNIHKFGIKHDGEKSSTSSIGLLFSSRLVGRVSSTVFFGLAYNYLDVYCSIISLFFSCRGHFNWDICCALSNRAQTAP
jgi:hypothetical protein